MSNIKRNTATYSLDFKQIDLDCLHQALQVFEALGIEGKLQGKNYQLINPNRQDDSLGSFSFNIENGIWKDFASSNMSGKGFIYLVSELFNQPRLATAKKLKAILDNLNSQQSQNTPSEQPTANTLEWVETPPSVVPEVKHILTRYGTPTDVYPYHNVFGDVIIHVARYDVAEKKSFRLDNYLVNDKGVFAIKKNDGKELLIKISSRIDVVASTRDMSNQNWGMLVQFKDRDNYDHEIALPKELLSGGGENYRQELLNRGVDIMPGSAVKDALTGYLMEAKPVARAWCVDKMGWHKGVYVIDTRNYPSTSERTILQSENIQRSSAFGVAGTLEEWQLNIAKQCEGNSRLILTLCASLATPFIDLLGMENGGFHLRGQSSGGKTKALNVAGSVWGSPEMVKQWKSTANAMEAVALEHNDCILLLDELAQIEPDEAGTTAYGLANGTQKARANQRGGLRAMARWRMFFLSTGEISLAEHVAQANLTIKAGHEVRMLDIPADPGAGMGVFETIHSAKSPQIFADQLKSMCEKYYGVAADALLTNITQNNDAKYDAIEFVTVIQKQFVADFVPEGSHGQVGRAASRFGMVAGVGEFCIKIGLLPWAAGQAIWGIERCYQDWLLNRGGNTASEELRAVHQVRSIIEQHGESRFTLLSPEYVEDNIGHRTANRIGFRKILNDGATEYWVMPEMYKNVLCENFDPKVVTKVLVDKGILKPNKSGEHTWVKRYPGSGPNGGRVYIIHASIYEQPQINEASIDMEMVDV